jgi:pantoate--beta-alanine ligase
MSVEGFSDKLGGPSRPSHFRGCDCDKALQHHGARAYFGQKDFQQTVVIRQMAKDLDMDINIVTCPTIRERDGLAISSRNAYLNEAQRAAAPVVFRCLNEASGLVESGIIDTAHIQRKMQERILAEPAVSGVDYMGYMIRNPE